jgi:dolichol-phosphate mannosyltransferase
MKPKVSILIPARNEQKTIPLLLGELELVLKELTEQYQFHVLVLDDGSIDDTAALVKQYKSKVYSTGLCSFTRNFGKEAAIAAGIERCESDIYLIMDGDLQHPPTLIPPMIQQWEKGFKVVEAIKSDRGSESFVYKQFSRLFYKSMKTLGSLDLENLSDYKLLDREVVVAIRQFPEKNRFFRGLIDWMGFPKHQIPFQVPTREHGKSSWSTLELIKFSVSSISSFSAAPLQLVTLIGAAMLMISVIMGTVTLAQWMLGQAVTGFTTVIILLLMIGSMLMVSLGLIGLYLSKIYDEIKGRPAYLIKEEFGISPGSEE